MLDLGVGVAGIILQDTPKEVLDISVRFRTSRLITVKHAMSVRNLALNK